MKFAIAILGGGPAATGPLLWAAQAGRLEAVLDRGVAIVEREREMGGSLDRYIINADSMGTSFLECIDAPHARRLFAGVHAAEVTRRMESLRQKYPPLRLIAEFERCLGRSLEEIVRTHPGCAFLPQTTVASIHLQPDGGARVRFAAGGEIGASTLVVGMGGQQDLAATLDVEIRPGLRLSALPPEKLIPSGRLLTDEGIAAAASLLRRTQAPRVVVLGGSHSAFSSAWVLLNKLSDVPPFGEGAITIAHRRAPRVWYATEEEARADDYFYTPRDVCPMTGRVHRMGGLRNDGRELWRRLSERPGAEREPRAKLLWLADPAVTTPRLMQILQEASLVVPALGYRFNTVPVYDVSGRRLPLMADEGKAAVGPDSRLLLADGRALPNIFGVGLGSGYRPWGELAGEPSFDRHQNSLWLFQSGLGRQILEGIEACLGAATRASRGYRDEIASGAPVRLS